MHGVTLAQLRPKLEDARVALVNVLGADSWRTGRIPGSIHLPLADIPARARRVLPDLDREIITYCGGFT